MTGNLGRRTYIRARVHVSGFLGGIDRGDRYKIVVSVLSGGGVRGRTSHSGGEP